MAFSMYPLLVLVGLVSVAWLLRRGGFEFKRRLPLPPGPSAVPFIGNLLDLPTGKAWLTYAAWAKVYGDIISLRVLGQTIIILNSAQDVKELFIARAANYSDRVRLTMVELTGWRDGVAIVPPGEKFRKMRRFMTQLMGSRAFKNYIPIQEGEVEAFLRRILACPEDLAEQTFRLTGSIILRLVYGYEVTSDDDPLVKQADTAANIFLTVTTPGWIVDMFPVLLHVPSWLPGMGFKRKAMAWRKLVEESRRNTLDWTRDQIAAGKLLQCFAADLLGDDERMKDEALFAVLLGDLYLAAFDTTSTTLASFFLIIALHPDVQQRAQKEIDSVTNGARMPVYGDRERMPYVQAVVKELHRWHPVAPMGIPHCAAADDEYKGYTIPKGAIIFANVWSILHNEDQYPDPTAFKPERHLEIPSQTSTSGGGPLNEDPTKYAFGFGSRQCAGRHVAESTVFLLVAKVLATCDVLGAVDGRTGVPLSPETVDYLPGIVSKPSPFEVTIRARSDSAKRLLSCG